MEKITIDVMTFDVKRLPNDSMGARFREMSEYLTKHNLIPPIGMELGVEDEILEDENPKIKDYKTPCEYIVVTNLTLRPWRNEIQVTVNFKD